MARPTPMIFALPQLLWLLAIPALLLVWELSRKRRFAGADHPKILRAEAGLSTVSLADPTAGPRALSRRRILLCAGLAFGVVAVARPQWGRLDEPVFDQSREIIIALDLSRSMTSPDVKPTRLERSKLLIQSLLDKLKGERVGLIVFSGTAFLQAPVSADYEILREFLPSLGPDFLPDGGTNYDQLISTALDSFGEGPSADRYLIILSDGEATDDDWREKVPALSKRGIRVIGLGVGTAKGAMIPDGSGGFMKDENGAVVLSKLESGTLRELANATHGAYRDASTWVDLPALLDSTVETGRKGRFVEQNTVRHVERYQWALAMALFSLIASFWLEFPVTPKSRDIRLGHAPRPKQALAAASLAFLFFLGARVARADDAATEADPAALLSKVVGRLSVQDQCSALDWAEMANETLTWGQHLGSSGKDVPEAPVRDALTAVDRGSKADPKAADWPKIKAGLEDFLKKPEDKKQQQNQDQNKDEDKQKDQKQDRDNKQDQKQDSKGGQPKDSKGQGKDDSKPQSQQSGNPQDSKDKSGQQQQPQQDEGHQDAMKRDPNSGLGKMDASKQPPPEKKGAGAMQKVGGVQKEEQNDPAMKDPQLAVSLEKLEQLKNSDSPAELFDLLRKSEPAPPPVNTGKNW